MLNPPNVKTRKYQTVVQGGAAKTLSFDLNGNLIQLTANGSPLTSYSWDAAHRCVAINEVGGTYRTEFVYDGNWRRVKIIEKDNGVIISERRFIWDGFEMAEERDANDQVVKRFFSQGFQIVSGPNVGIYFYTKDHLGSIREVVDANGNVVNRYDYLPFGQRTKVSGTLDSDFGYTGHFTYQPSWMVEEHVLSPFRIYRPDLGRWTQPDFAGMVDGPNDMIYVGNNVINYVDPLGLVNWKKVVTGALTTTGSAATIAGGIILTGGTAGVASPLGIGAILVGVTGAGLGLTTMAAGFADDDGDCPNNIPQGAGQLAGRMTGNPLLEDAGSIFDFGFGIFGPSVPRALSAATTGSNLLLNPVGGAGNDVPNSLNGGQPGL